MTELIIIVYLVLKNNPSFYIKQTKSKITLHSNKTSVRALYIL